MRSLGGRLSLALDYLSPSACAQLEFRLSTTMSNCATDSEHRSGDALLRLPADYQELHRRGVNVNHKRVLRLLREDNLLCLRQRAFGAHNRLQSRLDGLSQPGRGLALSTSNQLWVADINLHPAAARVRLSRRGS